MGCWRTSAWYKRCLDAFLVPISRLNNIEPSIYHDTDWFHHCLGAFWHSLSQEAVRCFIGHPGLYSTSRDVKKFAATEGINSKTTCCCWSSSDIAPGLHVVATWYFLGKKGSTCGLLLFMVVTGKATEVFSGVVPMSMYDYLLAHKLQIFSNKNFCRNVESLGFWRCGILLGFLGLYVNLRRWREFSPGP